MERSWIEKAKKARVLLQPDTPFGRKMVEEERAALTLSLTRASLRNYLNALNFIEAVKEQHPQLAEKLVQQSAVSVNVLSRWAKYDSAGMRRYVESLSTGSVALVIKAEQDARTKWEQNNGINTGPQYKALLERLDTFANGIGRWTSNWVSKPEITAHLKNLGLDILSFWQLAWSSPSDEYASAYGVTQIGSFSSQEDSEFLDPYLRELMMMGLDSRHPSARFMSEQGNLEIIGIIEMPQYELLETYRREAKALWARAVVAATLYPVVIVLLPDETRREETSINLPILPARRLGLKPEAQSAVRRRSYLGEMDDDPYGKWIRYPSAGYGCVVLTTPATFIHDFFDLDDRTVKQARFGVRDETKSKDLQ